MRRVEVDASNGCCPATEQRERKAEEQKIQQDLQNQPSAFTVKDVVELYLTQHIEDRKVNGKIHLWRSQSKRPV